MTCHFSASHHLDFNLLNTLCIKVGYVVFLCSKSLRLLCLFSVSLLCVMYLSVIFIYLCSNRSVLMYMYLNKQLSLITSLQVTFKCIYEKHRIGLWLERAPCEHEVVGSILGRNRPKSLKLVVVAFPLGP